MNPKVLIEGQTIRICDHRRGGIPHDFNDPTSDVHIHKETNSGPQGKVVIRIPLKGKVSVLNELKTLPRENRKQIQERLREEIETLFRDEQDDAITKENFFYQISDLLHKDWQDKLNSKQRAMDVCKRLAETFDLGHDISKKIVEYEQRSQKMSKYTQLYKSQGRRYCITIAENDITLGELSGKYKNKY